MCRRVTNLSSISGNIQKYVCTYHRSQCNSNYLSCSLCYYFFSLLEAVELWYNKENKTKKSNDNNRVKQTNSSNWLHKTDDNSTKETLYRLSTESTYIFFLITFCNWRLISVFVLREEVVLHLCGNKDYVRFFSQKCWPLFACNFTTTATSLAPSLESTSNCIWEWQNVQLRVKIGWRSNRLSFRSLFRENITAPWARNYVDTLPEVRCPILRNYSSRDDWSI